MDARERLAFLGNRRVGRPLALIAFALLAGAGCGSEGLLDFRVPSISNVTAVPNPQNNLSFTVRFEAANVDSARVVYWSPVDSMTTPFITQTSQISEITVLGLLAGARYDLVVEGVGPAGTVTSPVVQFDSGDYATTPQSPEQLSTSSIPK